MYVAHTLTSTELQIPKLREEADTAAHRVSFHDVLLLFIY
jgi:hypothetical protein